MTKEELLKKLEALAEPGTTNPRAPVPSREVEQGEGSASTDLQTTEEGVGIGFDLANARRAESAARAPSMDESKVGVGRRGVAKRNTLELGAAPKEARNTQKPSGQTSYAELTVASVLGGTLRGPREALCHQRQRMPGLKNHWTKLRTTRKRKSCAN